MCDSKRKKSRDKRVAKKVKQAHTLNLKVEVLRRFEAGEKSADIARALKLPPSTVRSFKRFREKIRATASSGNVHVTRSRSEIMEKMEKLLLAWIEDQKENNLPLSQMIIQEKAKSLYNNLKDQCGESSQSENFMASRGWFNRFKHRSKLHNLNISDEAASLYSDLKDQCSEGTQSEHFMTSRGWSCRFKHRSKLHNLTITDDAASADDEVAEKIPDILLCTIEEGCDTPKQEFDVDESPEPSKNLTVELLSRAFTKLDEVIEIFSENDTNKQRSSIVAKALTDGIKCYKNLYHKKNKQHLQLCLDGLFKRNLESQPSTSGNQLSKINLESQPSTSTSQSSTPEITEFVAVPSTSDEDADDPARSSPSSR